MSRGAWRATVHSVANSQTPLNMHSCSGYHVCDAKQTCIANKGELTNYSEHKDFSKEQLENINGPH